MMALSLRVFISVFGCAGELRQPTDPQPQRVRIRAKKSFPRGVPNRQRSGTSQRFKSVTNVRSKARPQDVF
jgi:hypothetical protein